jgi:hypothetical protein
MFELFTYPFVPSTYTLATSVAPEAQCSTTATALVCAIMPNPPFGMVSQLPGYCLVAIALHLPNKYKCSGSASHSESPFETLPLSSSNLMANIQRPDVLTYRLNGKMVYVTPANDYEVSRRHI